MPQEAAPTFLGWLVTGVSASIAWAFVMIDHAMFNIKRRPTISRFKGCAALISAGIGAIGGGVGGNLSHRGERNIWKFVKVFQCGTVSMASSLAMMYILWHANHKVIHEKYSTVVLAIAFIVGSSVALVKHSPG